MPYYNKPNNELKYILKEEINAKNDLSRLQSNCKSNSNKVYDFKFICLQNKINTLHHKIKDIMIGNTSPKDDNTIA
ncbi:MAG: hypothetical protein IJ848_01370 [Alphaproteobacteria bacterium]|nr:hypothetical protein [Alphaproteobacteria bacterium]